jgi:hypothetical protein
MQAFGELVDLKQHGPKDVEEPLRVVARAARHHEQHGTQHGGEGGVLIENDLHAGMFVNGGLRQLSGFGIAPSMPKTPLPALTQIKRDACADPASSPASPGASNPRPISRPPGQR